VLTFTPPDTSGVLVDGVAPTITSVTGPAAGTYIVGQNLDFTVQFDDTVEVTGTPRLQLTIGSTTRYATYVSGSGSRSHADLPLHGAIGRPGQRWHCRCVAD
jgi:hypothetical protein